jgi:hypothetical protein
MTSTERKRIWRREHPEQSREAERLRAQARRWGHWGESMFAADRRPCASQDSYYRYEWSVRRFLQRINWPKIGPGSMKMSLEERKAAHNARFVDRVRALGIEVDGTESAADLIDKVFSA